MIKDFSKEMMILALSDDGEIDRTLFERKKDYAAEDSGSFDLSLIRDQIEDYEESMARIRLCVEALPKKERQALTETYGTGDKVAAAAMRLGISRNTLGKYRGLGLSHLMELYHGTLSETELRKMALDSLFGKGL